ncbi:hypothetical protein FA95DRAFT_1612179 [Auriscalpium vulgare]|uniref:Uncharacterized protein n=1 Tax=Auriscalpium vulgare TaxID=40419 RepID=A0ACB8R7T5_9AGAM|nr:hypothetical protein FA95DRAFT_1612179 [Auriscalpium vulgare]
MTSPLPMRRFAYTGRVLRAGYLPVLYEVIGRHPLRPLDTQDGVPIGRTFVYTQDTSRTRMRALNAEVATLEVPGLTAEECQTQKGLLKLLPGDAIFARSSLDARDDGLDDVLQVLVLGRDHILMLEGGQEAISNYVAGRDTVLGTRETRHLGKAHFTNGRWSGGTAFERTGQAHPVQNSRAFGLAHSYEQPTQLFSPNAGNKMSRAAGLTQGHIMRGEVIKESIALGLLGGQHLPVSHCERMAMQSDLVNAPRIGSSNNTMFFNVQLNIASAVKRSDASKNLSPQLGVFGAAHRDQHDDPAGLSCMISLSDLPNGYHSGLFHLLEIGVFVDLSDLKLMYFNGLRRHGGTPPRSSDDTLQPWACRYVTINYPPNAILENRAILAIAALRPPPEGKEDVSKQTQGHPVPVDRPLFTMDPAMRNNPEDPTQQPWSHHATFAADGEAIMPRKQHLEFIIRSLYSFCVFILAQVPQITRIRIDRAKFFSAFSYDNEANERVEVDDWPLAPALNDLDAGAPRREAARLWINHRATTELFIPYLRARPRRPFDIATEPYDATVAAQAGRPANFAFNATRTPAEQLDVDSEEDDEADDAEQANTGAQTRSQTAVATRQELDRARFYTTMQNTANNLAVASSSSLPGVLGKHPSTGSDIDGGVASRTRRRTARDVDLASVPPNDNAGDSSPLDVEMSTTDVTAFDNAAWTNLIERLCGLPSSDTSVVTTSAGMLSCWRNRLIVNIDPTNGRDFYSKYQDFPGQASTLFSLQTICTEFNEMLQSYDDIRLHNRFVQATSALKHLGNTLERIGSPDSWHSAGAVKSVSSAWQAVDFLSIDPDTNSMEARHAQYGRMLNHSILWMWLESLCLRYSNPDPLPGSDGLRRLAIKLRTIIERRLIGQHVIPSSYHPAFPPESYEIPFSARTPHYDDFSDLAKQKRLYLMLFTVLRTWLHFPTGNTSLAQSWLLGGLATLFGRPILLVSETYHLYRHIMRDVFKWHRAINSPEDLLPFFISLQHHPIFDPSSPHHIILCAMELLHHRYSVSDLSPFTVEEEGLILAAQAHTAHAINEDVYEDESQEDDPHTMDFHEDGAYPQSNFASHSTHNIPVASTSGTHSPHADPGPAALPLHSAAPAQLQQAPHIALLQRAVDVLIMMEYLIDSPTVHSRATAPVPQHHSPRDRKLLEHVATNLDKFLPFREKAPAVKRARTIHGPYAPGYVRTREGFFSALVFRTILYGAGYMFDHPFIFHDSTKLENDHATMTVRPGGEIVTEKYFVDNDIYGAHMTRSVGDATRLWDASAADINFIPAGPAPALIPFIDFRAHIIRKEKRDKKTIRVYPQCGELIGYLLTADYVYAGVVTMPSVDDVGWVIHDIARGGLRGLGLMGLVEIDLTLKQFKKHDKPPVAVVQQAFGIFYDFVSSALTPAQRAHMGWDVIMAEHLLCKISRLSKAKKGKLYLD